MIPLPSLRIDRLANRPQNLEAGSRVLRHVMVPFPHKGADGGWGGIEVRNAVLVDNVPQTTNCGEGRKNRKNA